MKTGKQTAVFDCKQYNAKLPKEQWRMLSNDETVQMTITYAASELPDMFKVNGQPDEFVRGYASKSEKENAAHEKRAVQNDRVAVRFKVGQNCKWFDKFGKATQRPDNTMLDGKKFEVNVDFARKAKSLTDKLAPCGYWANAIMYKEIEDNPFAGEEFEKDDADADAEAKGDPDAEPGYVQHFDDDTEPAAEAADEGDLPF